MTKQKQILDFYSQLGAMTSPGKYADLLERLPNEVESLVHIVQGLVIHEFVASTFYGIAVSEQRRLNRIFGPSNRCLAPFSHSMIAL